MAARVTATEVKGIMDNCTTLDATVNTFIEAGTLIIDKIFGEGDTSNLTKEIERWFVAHMLASTVARTADTEKLGDAQIKYTGQWGKKLESTPYGQMVLVLDTTGKMANVGKMAASIYAVKKFD
jgi:hypothetical protein